MQEQKTRSFICIDFPDEIVKEVARIQSLIEKQKFTGKLTELENIHITLKFLGHITPSKLQQVKTALSKIHFPPLELTIDSAGTFNFHQKPKIVWLKIKGNIFQLQKTIDESLSKLFPLEKRFMSHLTIARIKHTKTPKDFIEYVSNVKPKPLKFKINSFKLKSSTLKPYGPEYTTLEEYKLNSPAKNHEL